MSGNNFTTLSTPVSITNLSGGLNSTASALDIEDNEASSLQNIDFDVFGAFRKRNGYSRLNTSAFNSGATFTGLYHTTISGTDYLIATCGNKIAKMDSLDGTWDDISAALTITAGNNNLFSFTTLNNVVLATNGIDPPIKWTGSGNAAAADVPSGLTDAKFTETWFNYAFYANVIVSATSHPTRFYWSGLKDPTSWTSTDFIDVNLNDGQAITGIKALGDRLVIFKERSIHNVFYTGDTDVPFIVRQSDSDVGAISGYSIQEYANGLLFLAYDGIYYFDGNNSVKLSDKVTTTLDTMAANRFSVVSSGYQKSKNRYWLSFTTSGGSTNNRVITFDTVNKAFSLYKGHNANCFSVFTTSGQERIYFGDYSGYVYRADTGTSDNPAGTATAIDAYWKGKWFNFNDLVNEKGTLRLVFYYEIEPTTLTFSYSYDLEEADQYSDSIYLGTSGDVYGSAVYGVATYAASGGGIERRDLDGRGRVFRPSFSNSILDEEFQINGFGIELALETNV